MTQWNKENQLFIDKIRISKEALDILSVNCNNLNEEMSLLRRLMLDLPDVEHLNKYFTTNLWTLLGELSIPNNLGEVVHHQWPVLIFPFAKDEEATIIRYISRNGFKVCAREQLIFSELLHAGLYGGQPWYPSLRYGISYQDIWNHKAILLWIGKGQESTCSLAAFARKMQLQLRPELKSYEYKVNSLKYPAILKAFHTPHLGNVELHTLILKGAMND